MKDIKLYYKTKQNRKKYEKSHEQFLKEELRLLQQEQSRIQKRLEYLSNAGKTITINGLKWKFLLNPDTDKIIMVSEDGKLAKYDKWLKHKILSEYYTTISNRGYTISSQKVFDTRLVHRLVALAFVHNPDSLETVDHKDSNKENNHYTNLQWMTRKDNHKKAIEEDGIIIGRTEIQVKLSNDEEVLYFDSMNKAARHLEVNVGSVSNCLNPKQTTKTVKGYVVELVYERNG